MAGVPGFEPGNARIKTWCLTTWQYPKENINNFFQNNAEGEI